MLSLLAINSGMDCANLVREAMENAKLEEAPNNALQATSENAPGAPSEAPEG